jgi:hypothetical protein
MHFWSGTQKNLGLEDHETLNIVEYGYDLLYRTWGPSMMRRLDVQLNGYAYCRRSANPILHKHKARFYQKQCGMVWTLLAAMIRFAPNGIVRRRVRRLDQKYRETIGPPTAVMELLSRVVLQQAAAEYARRQRNPAHDRPKEEPFKRYTYRKETGQDDPLPYRTEWPERRSLTTWGQMSRESLRYFFLDKALRLRRATAGGRTDPLIDDYLIGMIADRAFGFGL